MSVLLQIESSVASAAACSQVGSLILHLELGRPVHPVTPTSGHRFHHVELCLQKRQEQEYVCSAGLSRERQKEGAVSWTAPLISQVINQRKSIPLSFGRFGLGKREGVSVFKICPSGNRNQEKYERLIIFNSHTIWSYRHLIKIVSGPSSL